MANTVDREQKMALGRLYSGARRALAVSGEDAAREAAIWLLHEADYDMTDFDLEGDHVTGTVQTLLMVAFMRAPKLADLIMGPLAEARIDKEWARLSSEAKTPVAEPDGIDRASGC